MKCFCSWRVFLDAKAYAHRIKDLLWQNVRMPVGVGVAPTKTLAKLANRVAKKMPQTNGVCVLDEPHKWQWVLKRTKVTDIWGIANRMAIRLAELQIYSAWDLATSDAKQVRRHSNINIERTINELNGISCLALEEVPPAKKQIYCTRSFGKKATTLEPVLNALSLYAARASEKLRHQQHLALNIHVFIQTSPFEPNFYSASQVMKLPYPTDDTRVIVSAARQLGSALYKEGYAFLKAGVGLIQIVDKKDYQFDLFHPGQSHKADKLMGVIDRINRLAGKGTLFLAAQGVSKPWYMRQQFTSPQYTTQWSDIPTVYAR